ncbi:MAG: hypothetical protein D6734_03150, partial [Candidatus Schekmanbacteria bacterium]
MMKKKYIFFNLLILLLIGSNAFAVTPKISLTRYGGCLLKDDGTVWVWGDNRFNPVQIFEESGEALKDVSDIAGGIDGLALKSDGTVWAWGANGDGQLGDGTTTDKYYAVQVLDESGNPFTGVSAISKGEGIGAMSRGQRGGYIGGSFNVALKEDGTVWAWGANGDGQLGDGTTTDRLNPVQVIDAQGNALSDVLAISAGYLHTVALKSDGTVWAWGANGDGQLGDGTTIDKYYAV